MNNEERQDLRQRTKAFALRIIRLYTNLPKTTEAQVIGKQLLRSGTSVGAHYREAHRARSTAEFVSKLGVCQQELEESQYWMELLIDAEIIFASRFKELQTEVDELMAIFASSIITARNRKNS
ncbi:MAG: four helix bundle protein [Verrucomicrobiales bacterium]|jgi:four helix bundle protein